MDIACLPCDCSNAGDHSGLDQIQMQKFGSHSAIFQDDFADTHRQFESSWTGAAGIEIEDSVARLLFGNVTMAADHGRKSGRFGLEVQPRQIVQHVDGNAAQFKHCGFRQLARPHALIDVAAHRSHMCNVGKLFENLRRADIPGMNDVIGSAQGFDGLRAQQAVRVRDNADQDGRHRTSGFRPPDQAGTAAGLDHVRAGATARCRLNTFSSSTSKRWYSYSAAVPIESSGLRWSIGLATGLLSPTWISFTRVCSMMLAAL